LDTKISKSLHFKIAFLVLSVLTFLSAAVFYIQYRMNSRNLTDSLKASAEHLSESLERSFEIAMLGRRLDEIQQALEEIGRDPHIEKIFIVNKSGEIKVSSDRSSLGRVIEKSEKTCQVCHRNEPSRREKTAVIDLGHEKFLRSVNPILKKPVCETCHLDKASVLGVLVTDISVAEIEALASRNLRLSLLMLFVTVLLVAGVFRIGFKGLIINRLSKLKKAAGDMEAGDFSTRVTLRAADEMGRLGGAFNRMAENLQKSLEKIESARAYLDGLINRVEDGIAVVDRDRRFVLLNDRYLEMFGKDPSERGRFIGEPIDALYTFHGEWCASGNEKCGICTVFDHGEFSSRVLFHKGDGGNEKTYESYVSVLKSDGKEIREVIEDLRDITLRKQFEKQMIQSEKLVSVGRLAAGVAHEINNPMASITTCAEGLLNTIENLKLEKGITEEVVEYLDIIKSSAFRCKAITERLLNFSSTGTGEFELLDINDIIEESINLAEYDVSAKGVNLAFRPDRNIPRVRISRTTFPQVVVNLILNSLYAVDRDGNIVLQTGPQEDCVYLKVSDDGRGIGGDDLKSVFDPFFTTKKRGEGSGLGLAICRTIIDNHKGEIYIESAVNEGTTVTVLLPRGER
jgi:signal transduction histidine kinase